MAMKYRYIVDVYATKEGSVHVNNAEFRQYIVEAESVEAARIAAIDMAYKEGGIEHINPRKVVRLDV
jgi:hypothetical protein